MLEALETDRCRLADIAAQILDLERALSVLRAEQALAQERLDAYKYPVLIIPNEITSEIFLHFLPSYPTPPPLTGIHSPTFLSQICHKWREIALTTPALWRAIRLTDSRISHEQWGQISEVWMTRSGTSPLSFRVSDDIPSELVSKMLSHLSPHRGRLEHLDIRIPPRFLSVFKGPMPLLRDLELSLTGFAGLFLDDVLAFQEVPRLRTAILNHIAASHVTLPWEQLTSLTLHVASPHQCVSILRQTPNLVHCGMHLWGDRELQDYPEHGPDITLPCLDTLVLTLAYGRAGSGFFRCIFVPVLRSLEVAEQFILPSPVLSLETFISKSECRLQKLRIVQGRGEHAISYPQAFPSISNISFTSEDDGDSEIETEYHSSDESDASSDSQDLYQSCSCSTSRSPVCLSPLG